MGNVKLAQELLKIARNIFATWYSDDAAKFFASNLKNKVGKILSPNILKMADTVSFRFINTKSKEEALYITLKFDSEPEGGCSTNIEQFSWKKNVIPNPKIEHALFHYFKDMIFDNEKDLKKSIDQFFNDISKEQIG